ncbi:MAG: HEAT repeat domain-containing protein [Planctomycetota bacterium]|jgi:HEAT repeat protein
MSQRLYALTLALILLCVPPARAERIGTPYRGPIEELTAATPDKTLDGRTAPIDGHVLWQFWWEHNKERYLARAVEHDRVHPGSVEYWFGAVARHPPREIMPVTREQLKAEIFQALRDRLRRDGHAAVRAEACTALGRLGEVGNGENLVVRELVRALERESHRDVRTSAILGLGMSGDGEGCRHLLDRYAQLRASERAHANLAFGLARYELALGLLVSQLPRTPAGKRITDSTLSAVHALGLMGPAARTGDIVARLANLVRATGHDALVMQAVWSLSQLGAERETIARLVRGKTSRNKRWAALLALAHYAGNDRDAAAAARELQGRRGFRSGDGQDKCFSVLALGELAARLDPNSKVRGKILAFLRERALESHHNHVRACAAIALGAARDRSAVAGIAGLLTDTTVQDHVVAAACVGLGLLRATEHAQTIKQRVLLSRKWNPDARGYAALGLALMGATACVPELKGFEQSSSLTFQTRRQLPLALGLLGDRRDVSRLIDYFGRGWKTQARHEASNAAFGFAWLRDRSAIQRLSRLAAGSHDPAVRALAAVALGYAGARDRVSPLARCYANTSHRNRFGGWDLLLEISRIL